MEATARPALLMCCAPMTGHFIPTFKFAKGLLSQGWEVIILTGSRFRHEVESSGGLFVSLEGDADISEEEIASRWPTIQTTPKGPQQLAKLLKHLFIDFIPAQFSILQRTLQNLHTKYPQKSIIAICESGFTGILPVLYGAPGLKPAATIKINVTVMTMPSLHAAPEFAEILIALHEKLKETGVTPSRQLLLDNGWTLSDRSFQASCPSLEYPHNHPASTFKFLGGVPRINPGHWTTKPPFWGEIVRKLGSKIIVGVCQGTVQSDLNDLVAPTLYALKDCSNILVVVVVGKKGGTLPPDIMLPNNARVWDYIPFDQLLQHTDIFITTCGYGALQEAIANGVPLLAAGDTEEKFEICCRAERAGVAVNLKTGTPTPRQIKEGVDTILSDPKYKQRALDLKAEMESFDPLGILIEGIQDVIKEKLDRNIIP